MRTHEYTWEYPQLQNPLKGCMGSYPLQTQKMQGSPPNSHGQGAGFLMAQVWLEEVWEVSNPPAHRASLTQPERHHSMSWNEPRLKTSSCVFKPLKWDIWVTSKGISKEEPERASFGHPVFTQGDQRLVVPLHHILVQLLLPLLQLLPLLVIEIHGHVVKGHWHLQFQQPVQAGAWTQPGFSSFQAINEWFLHLKQLLGRCFFGNKGLDQTGGS